MIAACRRMKAAWLAYEEANLPLVKKDKPGLKLSQYKDMWVPQCTAHGLV